MALWRTAQLLLAAALCLLSLQSARAGFDEGYTAYEQGAYPAAFSEFLPLARAGDIRAQAMLSVMYLEGQGTSPNYSEAAKWSRLAALQGLADAQFILGNLYLLGEGVHQDEVEASRWIRLAANQGYADAQAILGMMYARGRGVPQDNLRAYMWLNLAAAGETDRESRERTAEMRDGVAARLTPAQRAEAQEMARHWRPESHPAQGAASPPRLLTDEEFLGKSAVLEGVQTKLAALGYDPGPVDGVMGRRTRAAIQAFQADAGLRVDGEISDELIAALNEAAANGRRVTARAAPPERRLDSTGSGLAISQDGQIVTNHHVVADCAEIRVRPAGQQAVVGVVVADDSGNDLALLRSPARLPPAVLRNDSGIRSGDTVVAVGFPLPGLLATEASVTTGTVSALAGIGNDTRFLQMAAPVQPGNSGGPLLDLEGRVVGVVVSKLDALEVASVTGDIPQNVNFAIKASVVRSFLDASGVGVAPRGRLAEPAYPIQLSPASVGADAKAFTVLVECWK